jgi:hypothetical protein
MVCTQLTVLITINLVLPMSVVFDTAVLLLNSSFRLARFCFGSLRDSRSCVMEFSLSCLMSHNLT